MPSSHHSNTFIISHFQKNSPHRSLRCKRKCYPPPMGHASINSSSNSLHSLSASFVQKYHSKSNLHKFSSCYPLNSLKRFYSSDAPTLEMEQQQVDTQQQQQQEPKSFQVVNPSDATTEDDSDIRNQHKRMVSRLYSNQILSQSSIKVKKSVLINQEEPIAFGSVQKAQEQQKFDELQYRKKERRHKRKIAEASAKTKGSDVVYERKQNVYTDAVLLPEIQRKQYYDVKKGRIISKEQQQNLMVRETRDGYLDIFDKDDPHYWSLTLQVMNDVEDLIFDDRQWMKDQQIGDDPLQYMIDKKWDYNIVNFTRVLFILAVQGKQKQCQEFFEMIQEEYRVVPDTVTYSAVMQACAIQGDFASCNKYLHEIVEKHGLVPTVHNYGCVIQSYIKASKFDEAIHVVEMLREHDIPTDVVMHTMLLQGFIKDGQLTRAWKHFQFMQTRYAIMPDSVCYNVMMNAAAEGGEVEKAISMYYQFEPRGLFPDSTTFNTLIKACSKRLSHRKQAFEFADQMEKQGFRPSVYTLNSLIFACAKDGNVERGYKVLEKMRSYNISPNEYTFNLMFFGFAQNQRIDPERQSQNIVNAQSLLEQMHESGLKVTTATLNSFLQVFTNAQDKYMEALHHFRTKFAKFQVEHDAYSYGMLIYMFSKMGRVDRCVEYLDEMKRLGIKPLYDSYKHITFSLVQQGEHDKAHDMLRRMHSESGYLMAPMDIRHFQKRLLRTTNKYKELKVQRTERALLELD